MSVNRTVNPNTEQIIQGAGKIKLDSIDLGSFRDGVTITYSSTETFTRSDYALGEIDGEVTGSEMSVNTILEQATATNICVALGGNTSSSSSSSSSIIYDFGPEMAMAPKELVLHGASALDKTKGRRFTFFRVIRVGQTGQTLRRGTEQLLPVTFKCLLNGSGKYFRMEEPVSLEEITGDSGGEE
ncbi:MAG: hypothetical protein GX862_11685 [Leucobacter sp.]|jgi:hypothetical protein|nr:hypothetical protein [Leucobacter sp.]